MFIGLFITNDWIFDYWGNGGYTDANYVNTDYWTPANYATPQT